jgi:hypothetical protein
MWHNFFAYFGTCCACLNISLARGYAYKPTPPFTIVKIFIRLGLVSARGAIFDKVFNLQINGIYKTEDFKIQIYFF